MILNPINKSLNFLGKHHKKTFWGVVLANIFSSFLEMVSLALIPVLISVMLKIEDYEKFLPNYDIIEKLLAKSHSEKFILLSIIILFFILKILLYFWCFISSSDFVYDHAKNILQETITSANYVYCNDNT